MTLEEKFRAEYAIIGGSGTLSLDFPKNMFDVKSIDEFRLETPYGESPIMRLFEVDGRRVLTCRMHGWRSGVTRADASRQIFWLFREAGVRKILSEGGVGTINHLLDPRDMVISNDYIDLSTRKDVMLDGRYLLIMRDALCPALRKHLLASARKCYDGRIFDRGVYAVTDGRHFESPSEIAMLSGRADIVGQSMVPEVYLAREIGACYANLSFVVNYGEGLTRSWSHETLTDIFFNEAKIVARILINTIKLIGDGDQCECQSLRKETLLKDVYDMESDKG